MSEGKLIKIRVSTAAKGVIERTAAELDMKEIGVASRIFEWFGRQPDVIRKGVLGLWPLGSEREVAKAAIEQLAEESAK